MFYNIPKRFAVPMLPEHVYPVVPFFGSLPDSHDHEDHAWLREPRRKSMKKLLPVSVAITTFTTPSHSKDGLMIALLNEKGEPSLHNQMVEHEVCLTLPLTASSSSFFFYCYTFQSVTYQAT
jgi:hypothetical protein